MDKINNVTKISQVAPEVTWFLRNLGFSNYYIIKIYDLVGDAAIGLTEDNPYWLLEEFPRMGFDKADQVARKLGVSPESHLRQGPCHRFHLRRAVSRRLQAFRTGRETGSREHGRRDGLRHSPSEQTSALGCAGGCDEGVGNLLNNSN